MPTRDGGIAFGDALPAKGYAGKKHKVYRAKVGDVGKREAIAGEVGVLAQLPSALSR